MNEALGCIPALEKKKKSQIWLFMHIIPAQGEADAGGSGI
jgi:hypothetical protein